MIGCGLGVMMVILGLYLRTAFMPLKMGLTVVLPIMACFGLSMMIFPSKGTSWFAWTHISYFQAGSTTGMMYLLPMMTSGMLIGLAMDYEIFLFMRILEFREEGWTNQAAALKAISQSGQTITSSAIIMTLVFGGMMFGTPEYTFQMALTFCISVLFDGFVVRSLLEPLTLAILPAVNY